MITALMAARNAAKTIEASLHGLFIQSLPAGEIIVVDDASTDDTPLILRRYRRRLRVITKEQSEGFAAALNTGIAAIAPECRYIAINDADDISHPHRFRLQAGYLDRHPDVGICGSGHRTFGWCFPRRYRVPVDHDGIVAAIKRMGVYMGHSSFLIRNSLRPVYDTRFKKACDCHLLIRTILSGWKLAAIDAPLISIRKGFSSSITASGGVRQKSYAWAAWLSELSFQDRVELVDTLCR